jgi:pyrroloquinoline quinone (PQQ) biosynthesis protein C
MNDPMVKMRHIRLMKGCGDIGTWWRFFEAHGLSRRAFLAEGIPASQAEATGHAMAIRAASLARAEVTDGR